VADSANKIVFNVSFCYLLCGLSSMYALIREHKVPSLAGSNHSTL